MAVLSCVLWCLEVAKRLHVNSAYALEKRFDLEGFGVDRDHAPFHRHKWARYMTGVHIPPRALVLRVEQQVPGSARLFFHPLWEVLRLRPWRANQAAEWLQQLSAEVQSVVFDNELAFPSGDRGRRPIDARRCAMLEQRAGIDALACLTIWLIEAVQLGQDRQAFKLAASLFRVLLVVCTFTPFTTLAHELFEVYRLRIFPLVCCNEQRYDLDHYHFEQATMLLTDLLLALEDNGVVNAVLPKHAIKTEIALLKGGYGDDALYAFAPLVVPIGPPNSSNQEHYLRAERQARRQAWGLDVILAGKWGKHLPPELY